MGKAIGIDLGTSNTCAAIVEGRRPRIITDKSGVGIMPSMFAIDDKGNRLVGHEAKRQAQTNPLHTVTAAKRLIGRTFRSEVISQVRQVFKYEMLEGDNKEVLVKVKDQIFTLEQISAAILQRIKTRAEESIGEEVDKAVVTVPAYFNDRQRQAVRTAGKLAGLEVLRILNEPTAAALAYGLGRDLTQRIAVYDLGGGTFDISIINIKSRIFEVIATGGDTFLGGVDLDDRLIQYVLEEFSKKHDLDLATDPFALQRLRDACEACKVELSSTDRARLKLTNVGQSEDGKTLDIDMEVSREKLEELTGDLIDRTIVTCGRIFREANSTKHDVDTVILVGGQSKMPLVCHKITEFMGKEPSTGVNPDEAVAIGAAIMANSLADRMAADVMLLDVLPMAIGINKVDGSMHVLFKKNQPLPHSKTRTLTTSKDNQQSIMLRIYQGESRTCKQNELLGTFVFSGIRPAAKGSVKIEVTFLIDSEGILNLAARDKDTGQTVRSTMRINKTRRKKRRRGTRHKSNAAAQAARSSAATGQKTAPAAKNPTQDPTVMGRVMGWFKTLFG